MTDLDLKHAPLPERVGGRVALGVSYNGSAYDGWQSQPSGNTVQDKLEKALALQLRLRFDA